MIEIYIDNQKYCVPVEEYYRLLEASSNEKLYRARRGKIKKLYPPIYEEGTKINDIAWQRAKNSIQSKTQDCTPTEGTHYYATTNLLGKPKMFILSPPTKTDGLKGLWKKLIKFWKNS